MILKDTLQEDKELNLVQINNNSNKEGRNRDITSMMLKNSMKILCIANNKVIIYLNLCKIMRRKNREETLMVITSKMKKAPNLVRPLTHIKTKMVILVSVKHNKTQTLDLEID